MTRRSARTALSLLILPLLILVPLSALAPVGGVLAEPVGAPPTRDQLTRDELLNDLLVPEGPIDNAYFMPIGEAAPAHIGFEGVVRAQWIEMRDTAPEAEHEANQGLRYLPRFTVRFFTEGDRLVPVERHVLCSSEPHYWCLILSPGRVWSEPGDAGDSRASFPFTLVNEWGGNAHNGLATFVYDETRMSALRLQVTQETAPGYRYDFWAQAPVSYEPFALPDIVNHREVFARERAARLLVRPWEELELICGADPLARFSGYCPAEDRSAAGIVMDDALYLQPAMTRTGEYPYPVEMRHGVYSVTKSAVAALTLLRLAQVYGEGVFDARIADWVDVDAAHDGWADVTFADALNMATGVGETPDTQGGAQFAGDEYKRRFSEFMRARSAAEKLAVCWEYPRYPWGPGEATRYNSINTLVLSAALDAYYKQQEGPDAHLWEMMRREVYEPIGIWNLCTMHTVEPEGERGIPLMFMGLYPNADDLAKIATLLQNDGVHEGERLLHTGKTREAFYRTTDAPLGLPTGASYPGGDQTYHLSFWSVAWRTADHRLYQVPYMMGLGGNAVVLAPNGLSGFVLTDGDVAAPDEMVATLAALRGFEGEGVAATGGGVLVPSEIRVEQAARRRAIILDRVLLAWLVLCAIALLRYLVDLVTRQTPRGRMTWVWALAMASMGHLAWLAYRYWRGRGGRWGVALRAAVHTAVGYFLAMGLVQLAMGALRSTGSIGMAAVAVLALVLPLAIGLTLFRAPTLRDRVGESYAVALREGLPTEVISLLLALAGAIPVIAVVGRVPGVLGDVPLATWAAFGLATAVGALLMWPLTAWMVGKKYAVYPPDRNAEPEIADADPALAILPENGEVAEAAEDAYRGVAPSLTDAWQPLLGGVVALVVSVALTAFVVL